MREARAVSYGQGVKGAFRFWKGWARFLGAFRSRDRKFVEPPKGTQFPLFVRDYLSWVDPHGVRVFLVFAPPGGKKPTGIAFRRDQQGDKTLALRTTPRGSAPAGSPPR